MAFACFFENRLNTQADFDVFEIHLAQEVWQLLRRPVELNKRIDVISQKFTREEIQNNNELFNE